MWEKATGKDEEAHKDPDEKEASIYEVINTLVAHGHDKDKIIREYSKEEITLFYEKCVKYDMRASASFIENIMIGIGGAFGGGRKVENLLTKMKE